MTNRRWRGLALAVAVALPSGGALCGCAKAATGPDLSALCRDAASVRQLVADAAGGLSEAAQLTRIQALETALTGEAVKVGAEGDAPAGTAAANLAVALGAWKTDISLAGSVDADEAKAAAAAAGMPGCGQ